jgi:hypothetical protein
MRLLRTSKAHEEESARPGSECNQTSCDRSHSTEKAPKLKESSLENCEQRMGLDSQLLSPCVVGTFVKATPEKRTRRKSMSRRSGQNGCIQEDGNWYVVRFWKDVAGQEKRQRVRERICPTSGAGKLSASERKRRAEEIIEASGADTVEYFEKVVRSNRGITFREQAEIWLERMKNRKRKPVAPSTLENWERCLRIWLNPNIGDMPLDSVGNLALRNLGTTMVKGGLGASTIRSYTNAVKMVVASATNEEGDALS